MLVYRKVISYYGFLPPRAAGLPAPSELVLHPLSSALRLPLVKGLTARRIIPSYDAPWLCLPSLLNRDK